MRGIPKPGDYSFLNDPALEARARMSDAELNRALNEENAELWNFVQNVANGQLIPEKGTPTTWGTVYREAQEMVRNREGKGVKS
jgi:hypothetical protein